MSFKSISFSPFTPASFWEKYVKISHYDAELFNFHLCSTKFSYIFWKMLFSSVQPLSHVWLFATSWIAACQVSLSITNSRNSLKLMSIESVMPSSHLILCRPLVLCPQSLPASESFPMSQLFTWGGQSSGVSASASVLPMNTQDSSPLGWTGWISLQSKGFSRVFSNTTVQKHQFFGAQPLVIYKIGKKYLGCYTWMLCPP